MNGTTDLRILPRFVTAIAPQQYDQETLSIEQCRRLVASCSVEARGWAFPYVDERTIAAGPNGQYIRSDVNFSGFVHHLEEWRMYRSGQFVLRMKPWEIGDTEWQEKTRISFERNGRLQADVAGFLSFEMLLFTITEAYIFASRLAQSVPYQTTVNVRVGLRDVRGYALASSEPSRVRQLHSLYITPNDAPENLQPVPLDALVANPKEAAAPAITSLFQQFGWMRGPSPEIIAQRQLEFYR